MQSIKVKAWTWDTWLRFLALLIIFIIGAPISRLAVPDESGQIYLLFLLAWFPVVTFVLAFWDGLRRNFSFWWAIIPPLLELVTIVIMDGWVWGFLIPVLEVALLGGWGTFFGDFLKKRHAKKTAAAQQQLAQERAAKRAARERRNAHLAPKKKRRPH